MDDLLSGFNGPKTLSVSDLNALIRLTLEKEFEKLSVEGEIGNFTRASSGHLYFNIKDEKSQIRCVMWRSRSGSLRFEPEIGMQVKITGYLSVYEPRGEYQLTVSTMEPAGQGSLQIAFEKLKQKLTTEGLFDESHKQELPFLPRHIGIVTSPTGAAVRDIISVLERRHPNIRVTIYPCLVQGSEAAVQIVAGIQALNSIKTIDTIIVTRGGGSLEDLWPFNEEIVARAIYNSNKPVISAVGHEIDFTIADFVADLRAPTPSAAAEMVIGREEDLIYTLDMLRKRLANALKTGLDRARSILDQSRPERIFRLLQRSLHDKQQQVDILVDQLKNRMQRQLAEKQKRFSNLAAGLDALSPLKSLGRGYSIVTRLSDSQPITNAGDLNEKEQILVRFSKGTVTGTVEEIVEKDSNEY